MLFDYKAQYKNHTDAELAAIVQQPGKYQPEAVTAARELLNERGVEPGSVSVASSGETDATIVGNAANWLKKKSTGYLNSGTPPVIFEHEPEDGERSLIFDDIPKFVVKKRELMNIRGLCWLWGLLCMIRLINSLRFMSNYFMSLSETMLSFLWILGIVIQIAVITGLVYLHQLQKPGWIIVVGYMAYAITTNVFYLSSTFFSFPTLFALALVVYTLIYFVMPRRRAIYHISNREMVFTFGAVVAYSIFSNLFHYGALLAILP